MLWCFGRPSCAAGVRVLAAIVFATGGLRAEDAENANPATSPEDFTRRQALLTAQAAEVEKEVAALNRELNARYAELDRDADVQALRQQASAAKDAVATFLKTDAALIGLRQARDQAQAEYEAARRKLLDGTAAAQALYQQRTAVEIQDAALAFKIREADFALERQVLPRLYRDHEELAAARTKKQALARQLQQARADAENNSPELKELRVALDQARAAGDGPRPAEWVALHQARAEKEAALRTLSAAVLKDADRAVADARTRAAKIRADLVARDPEALALKEKLAGLSKQGVELKQLRAQQQVALLVLRSQAPDRGDQAPSEAGNPAPAGSTPAAAQELAALTKRIADLDQQRAELDYQMALTELQLKEGVVRRLACEPAVRAAEAAVTDAEKARRALGETSPALVTARRELEVLRRRIGEAEAAVSVTPAVAAARAERAAKEKRLGELRTKLGAEAVAGLSAAVAEATQAEEALRVQKLAADAEAKTLSRAKEEALKERPAVGARRQALETELRQLDEQTANADAIKGLKTAATAAAQAYEHAYATGEIQPLLATEAAATAALAKKTADLRNADARCTALRARLAAAKQKGEGLAAASKELKR